MPRSLIVSIERWPVAGAFVIARGSKVAVDVVVSEIREGPHTGRGEATPIYYHGETAETVAAQIHAMRETLERGMDRNALQQIMPRGAGRNAVDAALWDLDAKRSGLPACQLAGVPSPRAPTTAFTLSLGDIAATEAAARAVSSYPLLKLKLGGTDDAARVAAARRGAPAARLIVDANESWTGRDIAAEAAALQPFGVELIEQPVRAGMDHLLDGVASPIPFCADESCQDRTDLDRCVGRYAAINIKLDKAGGLTEALALHTAARSAGMDIMVGCMLSTSLGIAPAFLLTTAARWVDLDGPLLLSEDRAGGFRYADGMMTAAAKHFWG